MRNMLCRSLYLVETKNILSRSSKTGIIVLFIGGETRKAHSRS